MLRMLLLCSLQGELSPGKRRVNKTENRRNCLNEESGKLTPVHARKTNDTLRRLEEKKDNKISYEKTAKKFPLFCYKVPVNFDMNL